MLHPSAINAACFVHTDFPKKFVEHDDIEDIVSALQKYFGRLVES